MDRFDIVRRGITRRSSVAECVFRAVLAVAIPALLRWVIDGGAYGATMVVHLPSILMISIYLDRPWAVLTLVGSCAAIVAMPPLMSAVRPEAFAGSMLLFTASAALMVMIGHYLRVTVLELEARTRQVDAFNQELQHRTKNTLQMVAALAGGARKTTDPKAFYEALTGRLAALARANDLLRPGATESCEMEELVGAAIAPFDTGQIEAHGEAGQVSRAACTPLMMALHELCTNATKYGALSRPEGKVTITWQADAEEGGIELDWAERGGPPVEPPQSRGLGSRLLVAQGALKEVSLDFAEHGVRCRIRVE